MEDGVNAAKGLCNCINVADVAGNQFDFGIEVVGSFASVAMDLRVEIVEDSYAMAASEECVRQMRADEAGTTCNENCSAHSGAFLC